MTISIDVFEQILNVLLSMFKTNACQYVLQHPRHSRCQMFHVEKAPLNKSNHHLCELYKAHHRTVAYCDPYHQKVHSFKKSLSILTLQFTS